MTVTVFTTADLGQSEMIKTLAISRLKELLIYDASTGLFHWRENRSGSKRNQKPSAGNLNSIGYIDIRIDGVLFRAHRLAWAYAHGEFPDGLIDHINRIRSDNRLCNLRKADLKQNAYNSKIRKSSVSGHKGISWDKSRGKWKSYGFINGKQVFLGRFDELSEAIKARENFAKEHYDTKFYICEVSS